MSRAVRWAMCRGKSRAAMCGADSGIVSRGVRSAVLRAMRRAVCRAESIA